MEKMVPTLRLRKMAADKTCLKRDEMGRRAMKRPPAHGLLT